MWCGCAAGATTHTHLHHLDLLRRPRVHLHRPHEADVYAQATVLARALQAKQRAERDTRPLRIVGLAIDAPLTMASAHATTWPTRGETAQHARQPCKHAVTSAPCCLASPSGAQPPTAASRGPSYACSERNSGCEYSARQHGVMTPRKKQRPWAHTHTNTHHRCINRACRALTRADACPATQTRARGHAPRAHQRATAAERPWAR